MKPEEEEELKRRQLEELREKERQQKATQGCGTGCFGLVIVVAVIGWIASTCSGSSTSSQHLSASDLRAKRVVAQHYWSGVIGNLAFSGAAIGFASDSIKGGDSVTAQQYLSLSQKEADRAYQAAMNDEPLGDAWTDIQSELMDSASTYKKAIGEFKDGLGQDDSEKIAQAIDDAHLAGDSITEATHNARVWYGQNGGKWSDIEDYQTAEQSVSSSLRSLVNSQ